VSLRAHGDVLDRGHADSTSFGQTGLQQLLELGLARARNGPLDQPLRGIFENPGRLACLRVADDDAPCGFGSLLRNPRQLQRQRVRERRVTVIAADENGIVGRHRIDHPARGQLGVGPRFFVPIPSLDPAAGRKRLRLLRQAPHKLGFVTGVLQAHLK